MAMIVGCDRWAERPPDAEECAGVIRTGAYFHVELISQEGSFRQNIDLCTPCCRIMLRYMSTGGWTKYDVFNVRREHVA